MKSLRTPIAYAALAAFSAGAQLMAQGVTAMIDAIDHPSYAGVASQFVLTELMVDGETIYNGSGFLFCVDYEGISLDQDSNIYPRIVDNLSVGAFEDMDVWNRFSNAQDQALAVATARWFIDNYYESYFLTSATNQDARQYAFQNVLWEILGDGGTAAGLSFTTGNINRSKFGPGGSIDSPVLWGIMTSLLDDVNASGVTSAYQPQFEVLVALDPRPDHQDYFILAANPSLMAIPEPSSAAVAALGSLLVFFRRRR